MRSGSRAESALAQLLALEPHGITLGLDVIEALCEALDHPERAFTSVIVAGTNGKGSVAAMIEAALRAAGVRTGLYTSPHLLRVEERFVINGHAARRETLEQSARAVQDAIDQLHAAGTLDRPVTYFEATTALAFLLFRRAGVHTAVLEVGMGGRFDATNVVAPACAVITTIDIDHAEFLGDSLGQIAYEKAGIIADGAPVVVGETKPEPVDVLRQVAAARGAPFCAASHDVDISATVRDGVATVAMVTPIRRYGPITLGLAGRHQIANAAVAVRALEWLSIGGEPIPAAAIEAGLEHVAWPGRLERLAAGHGRWVVLDAAHNPAAAAALSRYLADGYAAGLPLVFGALRDKDVRGMARALAPAITRMICMRAPSPRGLPAEELARTVRAAVPTLDVESASTTAAALQRAWEGSATICAAGSLYVVAEVMHAITASQ